MIWQPERPSLASAVQCMTALPPKPLALAGAGQTAMTSVSLGWAANASATGP